MYTVHNDFVRDAASKDMNCPKGKLKVTHYTNKPNKKTAEGCGERVHYVQVCPDKGKCTWQRDPRKPAQKLPAAAK